jgi:tRNA nucleotidyltransferase/poly(A) polymerase
MSVPTGLPEVIAQIVPLLPPDQSAWLVGGSVRDLLLGRSTLDFDFAIEGEAIDFAKHVANQLGGSYYDLDRERGIGRVLLESEGKEQLRLDFGRLRGNSIEEDLQARDFTVNALAINLHHPEERLDPTKGAKDLKDKILRACSSSSIEDDPVRALRAVRFAVDLTLHIEQDTLQQIKTAGPSLAESTPERIRDEIMHMLDATNPASSFRLLEHLGLLELIFPERFAYWKRNPKAFDHSMSVLDHLTSILRVLGSEAKPEAAAELVLAEISLRLGRFRSKLTDHLEERITYGRRVRQLLFIAALYHHPTNAQVGSTETSEPSRGENQRKKTTNIAQARARYLQLSNAEIARIGKIVGSFQLLPVVPDPPLSLSPLLIHRFYRRAGPAGVEATLVHLASFITVHSPSLPQEDWKRQVQFARSLFEAYFEAYEKFIAPEPLVNGDDLMTEFALSSGPLIGQLLEKLLEAQVLGEVTTREQGLRYAKDNLQVDNRSNLDDLN